MQSYRDIINLMLPRFRKPREAVRLLLYALCVASGSVWAEESVDTCPIDRVTTPPVPRTASSTPGPTHARADSVVSHNADVTELKGNAEVERDGERVGADYLRYNRTTSQADANGNVTMTSPDGAQFRTGEAHLKLNDRIGFTDAGTFRLPTNQGRGDMQHTDFEGKDMTRLKDVRFTTCPEGRNDWYLHARTLDLDNKEDLGTAHQVTLDIGGVPLIYLPYLSFPISNERKSGFLMPEFGYGSDLGVIVAAPYYFNLAPNYDATLTPRLLTERGLQWRGQFRYLGPGFEGIFDGEYLHDDKQTEEDRAAWRLLHDQTFNAFWTAKVDLRRVSDASYVNDFGERLTETSATDLPQNAELTYRGAIWTFSVRASDYQSLDRSVDPLSRPYARLPQLLLSAQPPVTVSGLQYGFDSEFNRFKRDVGLIANRTNLNPSVKLPVSRPYGFVTPELGWRYIDYSLERTTEPDPNFSIDAPFADLDSGLFFDREFTFGGKAYSQTLEPRLYYLYVPYREQRQISSKLLFDSGVPEFTYANLFRNNRFVGGDRIGDANQLAIGITSHLMNQNGADLFAVSIGRIHYFNERRVVLSGGEGLFDDSSNIIAEAIAYPASSWLARTTVQYEPEINAAVRSNSYIEYQPGSHKFFTIGYRRERGSKEEVDIALEWPLWGPWALQTRSLYSTRDNENHESTVGLQYNACCWAVRLYANRRLTQTDEDASDGTPFTEQRTNFGFEIELAGLGNSARR
ncbi:MAG: LPS-assembly protein LptD [Gammaproteobacteria bacterium]|nr:LPS-assembly protein LptD [Gammaproteobacteria bacterium]